MKSRFAGYYRPTEDEFKTLWDQCLFVPDTNVLLHLFRYGEKTRDQVFETFNALKPRLWVPYQVGLEFHRRWREIDYKNRSAYNDLAEKLTSAGNAMKALFNDYNRHQMIDAEAERKAIDRFLAERCGRLQELSKQHPKPETAITILNSISDLIGDQIGERLTVKELEAIYKEGEDRYKRKIPPGFRDVSKQDADVYGDLVIWKEVLGKANADQRPVIFVTDDLKDDWWHEFKGEKTGPRPELVDEFRRETGQSFYMYSLGSFMEKAGQYLNKDVDESAIKEIEEDESAQKTGLETMRQYEESYLNDVRKTLRNYYRDIFADKKHIDDYLEEALSQKRVRQSLNDYLDIDKMLEAQKAVIHNELQFLEHRKASLEYELANWTPQKGQISFDTIVTELSDIRQRIISLRSKQ